MTLSVNPGLNFECVLYACVCAYRSICIGCLGQQCMINRMLKPSGTIHNAVRTGDNRMFHSWMLLNRFLLGSRTLEIESERVYTNSFINNVRCQAIGSKSEVVNNYENVLNVLFRERFIFLWTCLTMQFHIVYSADAIVRPKLLSLLKQLTKGVCFAPCDCVLCGGSHCSVKVDDVAKLCG